MDEILVKIQKVTPKGVTADTFLHMRCHCTFESVKMPKGIPVTPFYNILLSLFLNTPVHVHTYTRIGGLKDFKGVVKRCPGCHYA